MHGRRFRERKRNKLRIISLELFSCGLRNVLFAAVPDPDPIEAADNPHDPDRGQGGGGAFSVDGKMVDPPVLLLAHQILLTS